MPTALEVAQQHYATRSRLVTAVAGEAARLWRQVAPARIADSWRALIPRLLVVLVGAQQAAAGRSDDYLDAVLGAQDIPSQPRGRTDPRALSRIASDGRDLTGLLYRPVVSTLVGVRDGVAVDRALATGYADLEMIVRTQVADAGRVADQVALTARPAATGYVRMVVGRTCSRCIVLAGQFYRWNTGFERHPRCDCVHVPAAEDTGDDIRTDPKAIFEGMSTTEQNRVFTKAGAEAVRTGADINQVVNVRRGMYTASGERRTRVGATRRGLAGQRLGARSGRPAIRLMPEEIFRQANGDRDDAIRLLRQHGYII